MPASEVALANRALAFLGADALTSLDDDTVRAARCKAALPLARDYVLRSYPWNCATRRALLPALAEAPAYGFARAFQLPADCLRVIALDTTPALPAWRVEGRLLLTDAGAPLPLRYVARVTEVATLDEMVADAIAARLAADLAYALTSNASLTDGMVRLAEARLAQARRVDAIEASQDAAVTADLWAGARF